MKNERLQYETKLWDQGYSRIMGLDEVGRGCLAGPVVAAGVILSQDANFAGIRDSKSLDEQTRDDLAGRIKAEAEYWTIQHGSVAEIEELNIFWASLKAMQKCVNAAEPPPDYLLVDGSRYVDSVIPYTCLTRGDDRSVSIGAASIIAKVYRDRLMRELHEDYPFYRWNTNVGYPTPQHYEGLKSHGISMHHRENFSLHTEKRLGY